MNKNNDPLLANGDPNPAINPEMSINIMAIQSFRQALACLVDRNLNTITQGFGIPMYTPIPSYMTIYVHPDIVPGGARDDLTYGGYYGK